MPLDIPLERPCLMGILNVTPDSFSDGGDFLEPTVALGHAEALARDGAGIIDIGGESTRPGGARVLSSAEELERIEPVVQALAGSHYLSIDTYHAETARRCLELGAQMINDVSALRADTEMVSVVKEFGAALVLMHSKETGSTPHATDSERDYNDVIVEVSDFLARQLDLALSHGIPEDRIVLDPGMGRFLSHRPEYSWELLSRFDELRKRFPRSPLLVATSRKGFLGGALSERDPISQLTALAAYLRGADIIRTHNVAQARQFITTWQQIGPK